jgi:phosphate transport system substrate-binding protein
MRAGNVGAWRWFAVGLALCCGWLGSGSAQAQGKRIAFVIGNAQYASETPLANPQNDARLIAGVLRNDLRFDEVVERRDLNRAQLFDLVNDIAGKARGADAVVVYYSGHGMRGAGGNYLIPVDARITEEAHLRRDAVPAADVVDALQAANPRVALLILDACRDSPYSRRTRSATKGLARMNIAGGNLLVAYATTEGNTADDGTPGNSPYARALAEQLRNTSVPVLQQFDAVRRKTRELTENRQNPTREGDLEATTYLLPGRESPPSAPTTVAVARPSLEDEAWALCRAAQTAGPCREYLRGFPGGRYEILARTRLAEFEAIAVPAQRPERPPSQTTYELVPSATVPTQRPPQPQQQTLPATALAVPATTSAGVVGAGAAFPAPLYAKWADVYAKTAGGVPIIYQAVGSGAGIRQIREKAVDFGASDIGQSADELSKHGLLQFPVALGAVVPIVNLKGAGDGELKLSGSVLADIYLGKITNWSDAAIRGLNPGLRLPDQAITVVRRADGTGTTFLFTNYLSRVSAEWKAKVGEGTAVNWPTGAGGKGNEGVAGFVQRLPGAIGYVEAAYATSNKLATVQLRNASGVMVAMSRSTVRAAAVDVDWSGARGAPLVIDRPGNDAWPIVGATFVLMHRVSANPAQSAAVLRFFDWAFRNGGRIAEELDYVSLPEAAVAAVQAGWAEFRSESGGRLFSAR